MKTVSEYLRDSLMSKSHELDSMALNRMLYTEWSEEFERLMRNRLIMGALRFGRLSQKRPPGITSFHIKYIKDKLNEYTFTGNLEMLIDIANLCLIEWKHSTHPRKHFKAIDRRA